MSNLNISKLGQAEAVMVNAFRRDLCTRTAREIREKWTGERLEAIEHINPGGFTRSLRHHNPIYYVAQRIWFDNDPDLLWPPLHRDILCKELLRYWLDPKPDILGLLVLIQRDSFKSTFTHGAFPMFCAMREKYVNDRDIRVMLTHRRDEQASLNLVRMKQKSTESQFIRQVWGEDPFMFASPRMEMKGKFKFDWPCKKQGITSEPSVYAAGSGARNVGLHFDLMCNDDLVDEDQYIHRNQREEAKFRYGASRCYLDTRFGKEVNSGTPYHIHDLWAQIDGLKRPTGEKMYKTIRIGSGGEGTNKPLSFPNRHTQEFLDTKKAEYEGRGQRAFFFLQYHCDPRSDELIAADPSWIQYIPLEDIPSNIQTVIVVDPAWKGSSNSGTGSDAAIAALGFERVGFIVKTYLLDLCISNTMTALDGLHVVFDFMKAWGTIDVAPEEHNTHQFRTMITEEGVSRGKPVNVIDLKTKGKNKDDRIVSFIKRVQAGTFWIANECRHIDTFVEQFGDFPQTNKKDALDVVAYSADPNITDRMAPRWNQEVERPFWAHEKPQPRQYRSRHCTV